MGFQNQLKRLFKIPPERLIKKIIGFDEIYTIAVREKGTDTFYSIPYSAKYWYADPLVFQYGTKNYLFAEAYDRKTGKGAIAVAELNGKPENIEFKLIIEEKYHMSFPMVFAWGMEIYMVPETSENSSINLYHAIEFPYKWECAKSIITEAKIVDTVVYKKSSSRIYMLASEINPNSPLEVRYQKFSLRCNNGDWVLEWDDKFNSRQIYNLKDRNAGNCFSVGEKLMLPTQISTDVDYGVMVSFREWDGNKWEEKMQLDPTDITVKDIKRRNIIGIHTYSTTEKLEIIDIRYEKYAPSMQWRKIRRFVG